MRADRRGSAPARSYRATLVKAGCLGLGLLAALARWLPGTAQARVEKLSLAPGKAGADVGKPELRGCAAAVAEGEEAFEALRAGWASVSGTARLVPNFGKVAARVEGRALAAFDAAVERDDSEGGCQAQRAALLGAMRRETWTEFLAQRQLSEQAVGDALGARLLRKMRRRGAPLRTQEKLDALREAVADYRQRVAALTPEWAEGLGDPEADAAQRRLGLAQFAIEDSTGGRVLRGLWEREASKKLVGERAHGLSVSVDPALRVMVRPEGLGNLQIFSVGPVGPPNQPATVNIGVMNDGSIADVYREHPVPPLFSVQPAAKVNLNLR